MSGIWNPQRRALEALNPGEAAVPIVLKRRQRYFLNKKEIFLLGVSAGIGTCADLHDVNIAVFGNEGPSEWPSRRQMTYLTNSAESSYIECSFVALIRDPTQEEKRELYEKEGLHHEQSSLLAERLFLLLTSGETLQFSLSGKKKLYLRTV